MKRYGWTFELDKKTDRQQTIGVLHSIIELKAHMSKYMLIRLNVLRKLISLVSSKNDKKYITFIRLFQSLN